MKAIMINDVYTDLVPGYEYEVTKVYSISYGYINLQGSPRRYDINSFKITHNGRVLNNQEAYRQYMHESAIKKIGLMKGVGK